MTFSDILKAVRKQYQVSCCFIADHLEVEDEAVDSWLEGRSYPDRKQAKDFAHRFALPEKVVYSSREEKQKQK